MWLNAIFDLWSSGSGSSADNVPKPRRFKRQDLSSAGYALTYRTYGVPGVGTTSYTVVASWYATGAPAITGPVTTPTSDPSESDFFGSNQFPGATPTATSQDLFPPFATGADSSSTSGGLLFPPPRVTQPTAGFNPLDSSGDTDFSSSRKSRLAGGAWAGIVIGIIIILALFALQTFLILRRRRRARLNKNAANGLAGGTGGAAGTEATGTASTVSTHDTAGAPGGYAAPSAPQTYAEKHAELSGDYSRPQMTYNAFELPPDGVRTPELYGGPPAPRELTGDQWHRREMA